MKQFGRFIGVVVLTIYSQMSYGQIVIDSIVTIPETCYGADDAQLVVYTSNSAGLVNYSKGFGNQVSNTFPNLQCGTYTITVTDATSNASQNVTIPCTPAISVSIITNDCSFFGTCDGDVTVNIVGGTPPFNYIFYDDQLVVIQSGASNIMTGLCTGDYSVMISDAHSCPCQVMANCLFPFSIGSPSQNQISQGDIACFGECNGSALVQSQGGLPPYTVTHPNGGTVNYDDINPAELTGLCAGNYSVTISDQNGFTDVLMFTITENTEIIASINVVNETSAGSCDGELSATTSGGSPSYSYQWIDCNASSIVSTVQNPLNLCAGNYMAKITDSNGCTKESDCNDLFTCSMNNTSQLKEILCAGDCTGEITLYSNGSNSPFTCSDSISSFPYQDSITFSNLCFGTYNFTIVDAAGCSEIQSFSLVNPVQLTATISVINETNSGDCDGSLTTNINGGTPTYVYSWINCEDLIEVSANENPSGMCSGIYKLTLIDANGCELTTDCVTLSSAANFNEYYELQVFLFPNPSSGEFKLQSSVLINSVMIYNMMGEFVSYSNDIDPDHIDFTFLPKGTYILKFRDNKNNIHSQIITIQ